MKWNKAVKEIEDALAAGKAASIIYHRKWMKPDSHADLVEDISEYDWQGQICKAVNTRYDQLNEDSHIIDEVIIEGR
jgi:hypothetical protein